MEGTFLHQMIAAVQPQGIQTALQGISTVRTASVNNICLMSLL